MAQHQVDTGSSDVPTNGNIVDPLDQATEAGKDLSATDAEVSEILQCDAEAEIDCDERNVVVTEIIMSKTFTESIAPDREFIPIGGGEGDGGGEVGEEAQHPMLPLKSLPDTTGNGNLEEVSVVPILQPDRGDLSGVASGADVPISWTSERSIPDGGSSISDHGAEKNKPLNDAKTAENKEEELACSLQSARGELHGLSDDFRKLQLLLDEMSSVSRYSQYACSSDDDYEEEESFCNASQGAAVSAGENQIQESVDNLSTVRKIPRVIYRYRVRDSLSSSTGGKRWINRPRSGETDYFDSAVCYSLGTTDEVCVDKTDSKTKSPPDDAGTDKGCSRPTTLTVDSTGDSAESRDLVSVTVEVRTQSS